MTASSNWITIHRDRPHTWPPSDGRKVFMCQGRCNVEDLDPKTDAYSSMIVRKECEEGSWHGWNWRHA